LIFILQKLSNEKNPLAGESSESLLLLSQNILEESSGNDAFLTQVREFIS
jgi:hypothetical protein